MEVDATETSVNSSSSAGQANEKELCLLGSMTFVDLGNGRLRCKKSEEHICKHINGRRFLKKFDENEVKMQQSPEKIEKDVKKSIKQSNLNAISLYHKKAKAFMPRGLAAESSDSEEPDFWIPTVVGHLDSDDGKVSGECSTTYQEAEANLGSSLVDEEMERETLELSIRTKRMSIAVGPSSFASRKKKNKKASSPTFPEVLRAE